MATNYRKIHLVGERNRKEYVAAAGTAILPGHLLALDSAGKAVVHATAGGVARVIFAEEDPLFGKTVDDVYAAGAVVPALSERRGDVVNARLKDGTSYTTATALVSDGTGLLQPRTSLASAAQATAVVIGYPQEARDLTAASTAGLGTLSAVDIV